MNLKSCVLYNFGYDLTDAELNKLTIWYRDIGQYRPREALFSDIKLFLAETFPEKTVHIKEEDTSDITVLLTALNDVLK